MSKREILGYLIFFKGLGLIGLMVLLLGLNVLHCLYPVYWTVLALGAVIMFSGLGLAAASEKFEE
jgi:hypothetical protein